MRNIGKRLALSLLSLPITIQPSFFSPRYWVPPEGHGFWVLLDGEIPVDTELLLGLGDAEEVEGMVSVRFTGASPVGMGLGHSADSSQTQWGSRRRSTGHQSLALG